MAAYAFGRQRLPIELSNRARFVARVAIHHCVRSDQGKPVLMLVDVVHRNCPAVDVVAQIALRAVLSSVNVGVTILALLTRVRENRINVTLLACNLGMHASQRKRSLAVIELRLRTQGKPSLAGMAVFTRDLDRSVGIFAGRDGARCSCHGQSPQENEHRQQEPVSMLLLESPEQNHTLRVDG